MVLGIVIALLCALAYSISVILLKTAGAEVHPIMLNLGKNLIGLALLIPTTFLVDGGITTNMSTTNFTLLLVSGFFGIGIADAFTLRAMTYLSATAIALLDCLFVPIVIILSLIFLGERLNMSQLIGGTFVAVALIAMLPKERVPQPLTSPGKTLQGIILTTIGLVTMAGGIIMIKPVFEHVSLFSIITIRMAAGVVSSFLIFFMFKNRRLMLNQLWGAPNKVLVMAAFITSSYIAISLWIAGYKYLDAPLAAILNQTSTIFTVLLAVLILRERLTPKKIAATLFATIGVIIISVH